MAGQVGQAGERRRRHAAAELPLQASNRIPAGPQLCTLARDKNINHVPDRKGKPSNPPHPLYQLTLPSDSAEYRVPPRHSSVTTATSLGAM